MVSHKLVRHPLELLGADKHGLVTVYDVSIKLSAQLCFPFIELLHLFPLIRRQETARAPEVSFPMSDEPPIESIQRLDIHRIHDIRQPRRLINLDGQLVEPLLDLGDNLSHRRVRMERLKGRTKAALDGNMSHQIV